MVLDQSHVLNRAGRGHPINHLGAGGLHRGVRMVGCAMRQPTKGGTALEGDMQGWWNAGRSEGWPASGG